MSTSELNMRLNNNLTRNLNRYLGDPAFLVYGLGIIAYDVGTCLNNHFRRHPRRYFGASLLILTGIGIGISKATKVDQFSDAGPSTYFRLRASNPSNGTQMLCRYTASTGIHYIGNHCSRETIEDEVFQLWYRSIVSHVAVLHDTTSDHATPKLDVANLTMAGQYVEMQPEQNEGNIKGNLAFKDIGDTRWRLCATEAVGEYENFWLCPAPGDDTKGALVLNYGFHPKSGGTPEQDEKCMIAGAHAWPLTEDY